MKLADTRVVLLILYLAGMALHLACFGYAVAVGAVYVEDLQKLAVLTLAVYSVPLGVILGGFFGGTMKRPACGLQHKFWTAAVLSIFWNLLLLSRSLVFAFAGTDSITSLVGYFETVAAASTFLVSGALAYFFAK